VFRIDLDLLLGQRQSSRTCPTLNFHSPHHLPHRRRFVVGNHRGGCSETFGSLARRNLIVECGLKPGTKFVGLFNVERFETSGRRVPFAVVFLRVGIVFVVVASEINVAAFGRY